MDQPPGAVPPIVFSRIVGVPGDTIECGRSPALDCNPHTGTFDPAAIIMNYQRPVSDFRRTRPVPSPFPGMDPYVEAQSAWPDFPNRFTT
jgi:hypothetical protein